MTEKRHRLFFGVRSFIGLFFFAALILLLFYSPLVVTIAFNALELCAKAIIPSLFVYMIASDLMVSYGDFSFLENTAGLLFERFFKISRACIIPFLLGAVCGFPIGGKIVCNLYNSGRISKKEAETALGICNNTGPAFVIAGVGVSMLGSFSLGVKIYIVQMISAIITGFIFRFFQTSTDAEYLSKIAMETALQKSKKLMDIISNSAIRLLSICACVVFFSILSGVLCEIINLSVLKILISSVMEIGSATKYLSSLDWIPASLLMPIISSTVSFSGISVYMQTKIFSDQAGISMKIYLLEKIFCAALSFTIYKILFV